MWSSREKLDDVGIFIMYYLENHFVPPKIIMAIDATTIFVLVECIQIVKYLTMIIFIVSHESVFH